jgi:hypothetical protein
MAHKVIDLHCDSVYSLMDGKDLREAIVGLGGVVGVNFFSAFLYEPFRLVYEKEEKNGNKDPDTFTNVPQSIIADHIDYMRSFVQGTFGETHREDLQRQFFEGARGVGVGCNFKLIPKYRYIIL